MLSEAMENYLSALLRLEEAGGAVGTGALAERLGVSRPSASHMLARLDESGHVLHEPYRGARLTPRGRRAAVAVRRRHRLVETFLVDVLGMDPDTVHEEAHRLEHAFSDAVIERLDDWLGRPDTDPHGSPIPRGEH